MHQFSVVDQDQSVSEQIFAEQDGDDVMGLRILTNSNGGNDFSLRDENSEKLKMVLCQADCAIVSESEYQDSAWRGLP